MGSLPDGRGSGGGGAAGFDSEPRPSRAGALLAVGICPWQSASGSLAFAASLLRAFLGVRCVAHLLLLGPTDGWPRCGHVALFGSDTAVSVVCGVRCALAA